jgi:CelD/BcsL family acetyltransferase involved in cellulose biosynthesis
MQMWRGVGRDVLRELGEGLDELHAAAGAPVTARRPWLQAWIDSYADYEPVAVALGDHSRQHWDAVAVLAVRRGRLLDRVVVCGHGPSDAAMLPARDDASADHLAAVLRDDLVARSRAWSLVLRHMVPQDLVLPRLAGRLRSASLVRGDVSPLLRVEAGSSLRDYVSSSHRKGASRIRNRMVREGLEPSITHVRAHEEIRAMLPEMERLHRARDEQLGRASRLDVASHREFFRRVVLDHAEREELEMTVLHLEGRLAAYVICFLDHGVHRMWNTRFDPVRERLSPGKLAMEASVEHAVSSGCDYDFMRGEERYKASYANDRMVAQELYASSGAVVAAGTNGFLALRQGVRDARARGGRAARVADAVKQVQSRWGQR